MTTVTVKINGIEYNLKGDEKEEYLHKVASYVDKRVKEIKENNNKLSLSSAAVLAAATAVDDLLKMEESVEEINEQYKDLKIEDERICKENESLKKQLDNMESFNKELQEKIDKDQNKEYIEKLEIEIERLNKEVKIIEETTKKYIKENSELKVKHKEIKFQLQTAKYKVIELQNKVLDKEFDLVKEKKMRNPLLLKDS